MLSTKRNKSLYIDTEALSTLALVKAGLITPVTGLMDAKTSQNVNKTKIYKGVPFPFSFVLAPKGIKNHNTLTSLQKGDMVDLINNGKKVGEIHAEETFEIDPNERIFNIYGTNDTNHPGVQRTLTRLGNIALSGTYTVEYPPIENAIATVKKAIDKTKAKKIAGLMLAANPLNRAHERIIRETLSRSDLVILFLRKPFTNQGLTYDIRYRALKIFVDNFLPSNKVIIVPFENTYIFAGYNELILDALLAKNYGCNELVIGKNHAGLGLFYDKNRINTIFDECKNMGIRITTIDEYVYCDTCKTLVSTQTCPHGQHHHIHYHSESIMKLIQAGIIPPSILVRKEISASILASLFPNRLEDTQELYYSLMPSSGLLEKQSDEQFYIKLLELYQTSSLT
ncbi:MAG TPA: sulfate adenylyltransferase [Epsilonproteobacteria bacterium]|nr:sulfate adenylyltransferase [Campylobacterota bacterium]